MSRTAALPMYDPSALHAANDALWSALAARLRVRGVIETPARLTRGGALEALWLDPSLLLAQTCGYPLATTLAGKVKLVATPCYAAPGCEGADYRSAVVVRTGDPAAGLADLRGVRCAVNDRASNSGMNVLRAALAPLAGAGRFFGEVAVTGSHRGSVLAVATGEADTAAIDCVTWALLLRHEPELTSRLRVLAWTAPQPGLPLVTARATTPRELAALRAALAEVAAERALRPVLEALLIKGFAVIPQARYGEVASLEAQAATLGYPELA